MSSQNTKSTTNSNNGKYPNGRTQQKRNSSKNPPVKHNPIVLLLATRNKNPVHHKLPDNTRLVIQPVKIDPLQGVLKDVLSKHPNVKFGIFCGMPGIGKTTVAKCYVEEINRLHNDPLYSALIDTTGVESDAIKEFLEKQISDLVEKGVKLIVVDRLNYLLQTPEIAERVTIIVSFNTSLVECSDHFNKLNPRPTGYSGERIVEILQKIKNSEGLTETEEIFYKSYLAHRSLEAASLTHGNRKHRVVHTNLVNEGKGEPPTSHLFCTLGEMFVGPNPVKHPDDPNRYDVIHIGRKNPSFMKERFFPNAEIFGVVPDLVSTEEDPTHGFFTPPTKRISKRDPRTKSETSVFRYGFNHGNNTPFTQIEMIIRVLTKKLKYELGLITPKGENKGKP